MSPRCPRGTTGDQMNGRARNFSGQFCAKAPFLGLSNAGLSYQWLFFFFLTGDQFLNLGREVAVLCCSEVHSEDRRDWSLLTAPIFRNKNANDWVSYASCHNSAACFPATSFFSLNTETWWNALIFFWLQRNLPFLWSTSQDPMLSWHKWPCTAYLRNIST